MPPRYAYWTILIDGKATAFRARDREELLPTFNQLARRNPDIVMRYFARGKLWDSPEQAEWASRNVRPAREARGPDWRPGGRHQDPRARFKKRPEGRSPGERPARERPAGERPAGERKPKDRRPHERHPRARRPEGRGPNDRRPEERPPHGGRQRGPRGPRKQR